MKSILTILLLTLLNCQPKSTIEIKKQNKPPESVAILGVDTLHIIEKSQESKLSELTTATKKLPKPAKPNSGEADADFQMEANEKLSKLLKHYGENMPDYFGGGFIGEKGNLVINIKGRLEDGRIQVINIIGSDNILFQSTKYSNKELIAIMDYLNDFAQKPENKKHITNLSAISQMEDYIEVCFKKMDKDSEAEFKKNILDSQVFRFKECGELRLE